MKKFLSMVLLVLFAAGCSTVSVKTDFDHEYDFSGLKTYRWASGQEINPDDVLAKSPLVLKRVKKAVDKALQGKGFQVAQGEDADMVAMVHAGIQQKMRVDQTGPVGPYRRGWYNPWWGAYGGTTYVSYYETGTLVVDIVDWKTKQLAWRGMGTKTVEDSPASQEKIDEVVAKILEGFPPQE